MPKPGMWDAVFCQFPKRHTARFEKLGRKDFQKRKEWPLNFSTLGIANLLRCGCAGLRSRLFCVYLMTELDDCFRAHQLSSKDGQ